MIKSRPFVLALLLASACLLSGGDPKPSPPADRPALKTPARLTPPAQPVRGAQIFGLESADWEGVGRRFAELKAAGVGVVILRVFKNPGDSAYKFVAEQAPTGVYFKTGQATVVADALGKFCELAHREKLVLIAWMTSRHADYGHDSELELRSRAWDLERKEAVPARGYSPLLPEVQSRLVKLYQDLAAYPIDGVLIQDDLVLRQLEDMNPAVIDRYQKETGAQVDPAAFFKDVAIREGKPRVGRYGPGFKEWRRWQNRELVALAEKLRAAVQAKRPGVPVGLNLYYETLVDNPHALDWYAQDLESVLASNLDYYAFMAYQEQMRQELELSRQQVFALIDTSVAALLKKVDVEQRVWIKLQTVDWESGRKLGSEELAELIGLLKKRGRVGLVVAPAAGSLDLEMLKAQFEIKEQVE